MNKNSTLLSNILITSSIFAIYILIHDFILEGLRSISFNDCWGTCQEKGSEIVFQNALVTTLYFLLAGIIHAFLLRQNLDNKQKYVLIFSYALLGLGGFLLPKLGLYILGFNL